MFSVAEGKRRTWYKRGRVDMSLNSEAGNTTSTGSLVEMVLYVMSMSSEIDAHCVVRLIICSTFYLV